MKILPLPIMGCASFFTATIVKSIFFMMFFKALAFICLITFIVEILILWINRKQYKNSKN